MSDRTDTFYAIAGEAIHGYGAQIMIGDGASPENFQAVAGVLKITPGEMSTADEKVTHLRSLDAHEEHRPLLRDSGPFTCEGWWLPNDESQSNAGGGSGAFTTGGVIAMWRGRALHNLKIKLNDPGSPDLEWNFRGYCSRFQPGEISNDASIKFTMSFQPSEAYDAALP